MAIKSKKLRFSSRQKNKYRIRKKVSGTSERPRLSVFRSGKHMYGQVISDETGQTLAAVSTRDAAVISAIPEAVSLFEKSKGAPKSGAEESGAAATKSQGSEELAINATRTSKSVAAALAVGTVIGKLALEKNISQVTFDRNGFLYHGRIRAVAEGARMAGLKF